MYAEIIQENTDEAGQEEKMHVEVQVNILKIIIKYFSALLYLSAFLSLLVTDIHL